MREMSTIEKPCIRKCCLNEKDVCMGCYRTLDDMRVWHKVTTSEKKNMLMLAEKRRLEHKR